MFSSPLYISPAHSVDEFFSHFPSIRQSSIDANFNKIADSLKSLNLQKLSEDGNCTGLAFCYAYYAKRNLREEFIRSLQFLRLLDDPDKMAQFLLAANESLKNHRDIEIKLGPDVPAISFKTVCKFLKDVSRIQANQTILEINARWEKTYSFIRKINELTEMLLRRRIKIGEIAFVSLGFHVYYIERTAEGFYLFEPNNIGQASLSPIIKDEYELAENIYKNCKEWITDNKLVIFGMRFIKYGDEDRELADIVFKLRPKIDSDKEDTDKEDTDREIYYPTILSLIKSYDLKKLSGFEFASALLDEIKELKTSITDPGPKLDEAEQSLKTFVEAESIFQRETIHLCDKYLNKSAFDFKISWLHLAARLNEISIVKQLLESDMGKAMVNIGSTAKENALYIAASKGHIEIVKLLLQNGANPDLTNVEGFTPLTIAAQDGHKEIVELLLQAGASLHIATNKGSTPLYIAAQKGNTEIVKFLLKKGANPDLSLKNGATPLYVAAAKGHIEIIKLLLKKGADPDLALMMGATPLFSATQKGNTEIVKLLLQNGANPDLGANTGISPLNIAAQFGHTEIVNLLLQHGAKLNNSIKASVNVLLETAEQHGRILMLTGLLKKHGFIKSSGFFSNQQMPTILEGFTPLHAAAFFGHKDILIMLLEKGADLNESANGLTALDFAEAMDHKEIVNIIQNHSKHIKNPLIGHKPKSAINFLPAVHSLLPDVADIVPLLEPTPLCSNKNTYKKRKNTKALIHKVKVGINCYIDNRDKTFNSPTRLFSKVVDYGRGANRANSYLFILNDENASLLVKGIAIYTLLRSSQGETLQKNVMEQINTHVPEITKEKVVAKLKKTIIRSGIDEPSLAQISASLASRANSNESNMNEYYQLAFKTGF